MTKNPYSLIKTENKARLGKLQTAHGEVETPIFMPVGTRGAVKMLDSEDLHELKAQIILGNTYHLYIRPGPELIEETFTDLHHFMNWQKPILTDSGGYQVFSLSDLNKVTPDGVEFRSHLDGSKHFIGPKESMKIQKSLGSDIVMCFDECPALPADLEKLKKSVDLTLKWAKTCRDYPLRDYQHLFGIIQGGLDLSLRQECLQRLKELDFEGYALGGLSVGEKNQEMRELLENFVEFMPADRARYLMGVGTPLDILHGVKCGLDMFDCVLPTRNARNGQFLTHDGPLSIKKLRFRADKGAPDPDCRCKVCQNYSRAYIRHLFIVGEATAARLVSLHNLHFYLNMMKEVREAIANSKFDDYYETFYNRYNSNLWQ
jgi:queuine tRNA-ribosyltransferase